MRVRFWGARGSLATPGPTTVRYGGNTSCIEITTPGGVLIIIDCGTGIRQLGQHLLATQQGPLEGHILISHTHWDHIQGIPFFGPFFAPGNTWDLYAPKGVRKSLRDSLEGQMQYSYFPVQLDELGAKIRYHELVEGTFRIADVAIRTRYLNHPALTFGYRLEAEGAAVVYASDHEPHSRHLADGTGEIGGEDLRHCEFLAGADLVIHDAQYIAEEYPQKIGWGHSTVEYALAMCRAAGVKRVALTHHDPSRDDDAIDRIVTRARADLQDVASPMEVMAATEGSALSIIGEGQRADCAEQNKSAISEASALGNPLILLAVTDRSAADTLLDAAHADQVPVVETRPGEAMLRAIGEKQPSLIVLEKKEGTLDPLELCTKIRTLQATRDVPIIVVADTEDSLGGMAAGVTDWLIRPFSIAYARTRMRAWLLRTAARWVRAPLPPDEEQRLATLHSLGILDTPEEQRFDRLTRLAAGILRVPVALVSLVDRERQWFKSAHGVEVRQTPRETSFCAHAVAARELLVVPDALADHRFADNPQVSGRTRVRFYAGCPLFVGQSCVGTLCVLDVRPRHLSTEQVGLLKDVAVLVERELQQKGTARPPTG
jgi:phosphoribosyl 1,2-cyclic phosphodiesterase/DNA-binding response OmpR family regulator